MKNSHLAFIIRSTLIACTLMIGMLASIQSASAQSPEALATVNIPFAFNMGDQTMPAGMYRIDLVSNHVVKLRGPDHAVGSVAMHSATMGSIWQIAGSRFRTRIPSSQVRCPSTT
jgi:hypothetical protein